MVTLVEGPAEALAGESIQLRWTVRNDGTGDTNAPRWYDRVYLSSEPTLTGNYYSLGDFANPTYLPVGASYSRDQIQVTIPNQLAGSYYLIVKTDARGHVFERSGEGNNLTAADEATQVRYLTALLEVSQVTAAPTDPWSGQLVDVSWTVTNVGEAAFTSTSWSDGIRLSNDAVLDASDPLIGSGYLHTTPLNPGQSDAIGGQVRLPVDISGRYYLFVVPNVQGVGGVGGTAAADTVDVTLAPPPDLVVTAIDAPDQANSGDPLLVTWTVTNEASGITQQPSWIDAVYISDDASLEIGSDPQLGALTVTDYLIADASYQRSRQVSIPSGYEGTYYLFVVTDRDDAIFEGDWEDNNVSAPEPVTVVLAPPDLQVTAVTPACAGAVGRAVPGQLDGGQSGHRHHRARDLAGSGLPVRGRRGGQRRPLARRPGPRRRAHARRGLHGRCGAPRCPRGWRATSRSSS